VVVAITMGAWGHEPAPERMSIAPEPERDPRDDADHREARPGDVWDLDVGPSFARVDALGRAMAHRRPGIMEGINELNGNLLQKFGPIYVNTLGHADFEGGETVARVMHQRDKFLYGSPGIFNLGLYDVFLFDQAVDERTATENVTGYQTPLKLVTEDRTIVTFRPTVDPLSRGTEDPNGFVSEPWVGAELDYRYGDDVQTLTYADGTRYVFTRLIDEDPSSPCDLDWNERALIWRDFGGGSTRDFMRLAREGKNRIYALTKVVDRFGNETVIERQVGYADSLHCRVTRVVEKTVGAGGSLVATHETRFDYPEVEIDGASYWPLGRITFFAGTPDEKVGEMTYHEHDEARRRAAPHLLGLAFGEDPSSLDETLTWCFQYIFPHAGGVLRSVEGPYRRRLRATNPDTGYCHPRPPSTAVPGARHPVGPVDVYTLDRGGRLRELVRPDGTGVEIFFHPDRPQVVLSHTWPFRRPAVPGTYERDEHTDGPAVRQDQVAASLLVEESPATGLPQVARRWDNYGRWWSYERNAAGYVTRTDSYDGQSVELAYEADDPASPHASLGRPLVWRTVDAFGSVTTHRYDDFGRLTERVGPSTGGVPGPRLEYDYFGPGPLFGQPSRIDREGLDPNGDGVVREETRYYEPFEAGGEAGTETVPRSAEIVVRESYSASSPRGGAPESVFSTLVLDPSGRVLRHTNPLGRTERVEYDGATERYAVMSEDGTMRPAGSVTRSATGAPARVVDPHGVETRFRYNGTGQIEAIESPAGSWQARFDDQGRFVEASSQPESSPVADQGSGASAERGNPCGFVRSVSTGVNAEGRADRPVFSYEPPGAGPDGTPDCGYHEIGGSTCGDDEYTPTECASLSNPRTRRVFCRDEFGCGQCPIAYSDDRYCIGGFCGGSCTMFPVTVCADGTRIPTCPASPPP